MSVVMEFLQEWARVNPAFVRRYEARSPAERTGGFMVPINAADLPDALAVLRKLPDGIGEAAARAALAPYWQPIPYPFDRGV